MRGKIAYGLVLLIVASVNCGLTPPDSPGDIDAFNARSDGRSGKKELNDVDCSEMNTSCTGCINLEHCYFAIENDGSTKCDDRKNDPNMEVTKDVIMDLAMCPNQTDGEATKIPPKFDPDLDDKTTVQSTTTTASSTTTSGSENTTTTASTTSSSTTTATPTTSEKTTQSSTTTETSTTAMPTTPSTQKPATSTATPDPSGRSGSKFDGWSFFGGILLTVGVSSIAFISFKYYKVRSGGQGGGANYNRF